MDFGGSNEEFATLGPGRALLHLLLRRGLGRDHRDQRSSPVLEQWAQGSFVASPTVGTRGCAMLNVAIHDAVNATLGGPDHPYLSGVASPGGDTRAAASAAAHNVLVSLNPANAATYDAALAGSLALIPGGPAKTNGIATGAAYAAAIIANRTGDGSTATVPYTPSGLPGRWAPTPPAFAPAATPQWGAVKPFVMASGDQFRPGPPPALNSAAYATAYNEVKELGAAASATRTPDQTASAQFWGFAGGATWLQIGLNVAEDEGLDTIGFARLFALLTTATADSYIAGWDTKFSYDFWRPVTAIPQAETDGNPSTIGDPTWLPLNGTPPHPSYLSTLSTSSTAATMILLDLVGDEAFCSTLGANTRCFDSLEAAALDAGSSRIWGGIHYSFDNLAGAELGRQIARLELEGPAFSPVPESPSWALVLSALALTLALRRPRRQQIV
jgi:hypothetical protein